MSRVLVVGTGPLLEDSATRFFSGQGLRTLHFARPLRDAGHRVRVLAIPIEGDPSAEAGPLAESRTPDGIRVQSFRRSDEAAVLPVLRRLAHSGRFDAVVGVNAWPAALAARAGFEAPLWADLNGWTMAEGATRAARVGHDRDFAHFWRIEAAALLRADAFSTVSQRQADALMGELALAGRLRGATFDWPFAHAVPNAAYRSYAELRRDPQAAADIVPPGAFVVLWSGGFNAWTDPELLAESLRLAMDAEPRLRFVATGGAVRGHDDATFAAFQRLAADRLPAGRARLLGWTDPATVLALHARADAGLSIDCPNVETRFGARNRLTNMMAAGVPVATTAGTEIAEWIAARGAGRVVPPGDAGAVAEALLEGARDPDAVADRARRAREMALAEFDPARTLAPLLAWCAEPRRSPDAQAPGAPQALDWTRLLADGSAEALIDDAAKWRRLRDSPAGAVARRLRRILRIRNWTKP